MITFALVAFILGSIAAHTQATVPFKGTIFNLGTEPAPYDPAGPPKEIEESPPPAPGVAQPTTRPMVAMAVPGDHKMFTARAASSAASFTSAGTPLLIDRRENYRPIREGLDFQVPQGS